jgi:hypothetical protein
MIVGEMHSSYQTKKMKTSMISKERHFDGLMEAHFSHHCLLFSDHSSMIPLQIIIVIAICSFSGLVEWEWALYKKLWASSKKFLHKVCHPAFIRVTNLVLIEGNFDGELMDFSRDVKKILEYKNFVWVKKSRKN